MGWAIAVAALGASPGAGSAQTPPAHSRPTVQQAFEAATALDNAQDFAGALAAWQALEPRVANNRRSRALIQVRKASALLSLGRADDAAIAAQAGLADVPTNDPTLAEDRFTAAFLLGRIAESTLDYASAAQAYKRAETEASTPIETFATLLALARVETFVEPALAEAALDRAEALARTAKIARDVTAQITLARAVLLLNRGDFAGAYTASSHAVGLLGGLKEMTSQQDVAARSDTAIAALLAGRAEDARRYMAYTGAGRLPKGDFNPASRMRLPDCGGDAGLKPADVAVVEFSVDEGGKVIQVAPVYAAGGPQVALAFARAANDWAWDPDQAKAMPPFYRTHVRVEVRCSTAFERPSIGKIVFQWNRDWLEANGAPVLDADSADRAALTAGRAALAAAEAKDPGGLAVAAAIVPLLTNALVGREETHALAERARTILVAHKAPVGARLTVDQTIIATARAERRRSRGYRDALAALLAQPDYAADPQARAALRLSIADADPRAADPRSEAMLTLVADDAALDAKDTLKVGALIRLASIAQNRGDGAAARAAYERTGLTAAQCAIADSPPKFLHAGGEFPMEARRWGFEGWVLTQYDIATNGRTQDMRAVLSYPPFIFSKAGADTMAGARYAQSYRPQGGIGCGGQEQRVRFILP